MDLSLFQSSAFDVKAWVNETLAVARASGPAAGGADSSVVAGTAADAMNAQLSTAIVRLQLLSQECSDRADSHMTRILSAMPRARRELKNMSGDLPQLQAQLEDVSTTAHSSAVSHSSSGRSTGGGAPGGDHIAKLEELDRAKSRLDAVRSMLQQAAAWDRLSRETDSVLDSRAVVRVAEHLGSLEATAATLRNLPGSEMRAAALGEVRRGFEAMAAPLIQDALARHDAGAMRQLTGVHEALGVGLNVVDLLASAAAHPLLEAWSAAVGGDRDGGSTKHGGGTRGAMVRADDSSVAAALGGELVSLLARSQARGTASDSGAVIAWHAAYYDAVARVVAAEASVVHGYFGAEEGPTEGAAASGGLPALQGAARASAAVVVPEHPTIRVLQVLSRIAVFALGCQGSPAAGGSGGDAPAVVSAALSLLEPVASPAAPGVSPPALAEEVARVVALLAPFSPPVPGHLRRRLDAACSRLGGGGSGALGAVVALHWAASRAVQAVASSFAAAAAAGDLELGAGDAALRASVLALCEAAASPFRWYHSQFGVLLRDAAAEAVRDAVVAACAAAAAGGAPSALQFSSSQLPAPLPLPPPGSAGTVGLGGAPSLLDTTTAAAAASRKAPGVQAPAPNDSAAADCAAAVAGFQSASAALGGLEAGVAPMARVFSQGLAHCEALTACGELRALGDALDAGLLDAAQRIYGGVSALATFAPLALRAGGQQQQQQQPALSPAPNGARQGGGDWLDSPPPKVRSSAPDAQPLPTVSLRDVFSAALRGVTAASSLRLAASLLCAQVAEAAAAHRGLLTAVAAACPHDPTPLSGGASTCLVGIALLHGGGGTAVTAAAPFSRPATSVAVDLRLWTLAVSLQANPRRRSALEAFLAGAGPAPSPVSPLSARGVGGRAQAPSPSLSGVAPSASGALDSLSALALRAAFECMMAPVAESVRGVAQLPGWSGTPSHASAVTDDATDVASLYSLQPSPYAAAVGETLLQLVQLCAPNAHPLVLAVTAAAAAAAAAAGGAASPSLLALSRVTLQDPAPLFLLPAGAVSTSASAAHHTAAPPPAADGSAAPLAPAPLELLVASHAAAVAAHLPSVWAPEAAAACAACGLAPPRAPAGAAHHNGPCIAAMAPGGDGAAVVGARVAALRGVAERFGGELAVRGWVRSSTLFRHPAGSSSSAAAGGEEPPPGGPAGPSYPALISLDAAEGNRPPGSLSPDAAASLAVDVATDEATLWLHALAGGTCALLLGQYLSIPQLDAGGARQLGADVEFLASVLSAVGVTLDPLLASFVGLAGADKGALRAKAAGGTGSKAQQQGGEEEAALARVVARMRGI